MINILIVEDNDINRLLLVSIINIVAPNAQVQEAKDGLEAVDKFIQFKPDLIFMDMRMPGLNGLEATAKIRSLETSKRTVIIALTASAQKTDRDTCLAAGMDDYISKPIKSNSIKTILDKWLPTNEF
jgi:CheY-like chemotaxis protein